MIFAAVPSKQLGFVRMIGFCEAIVGIRRLMEVIFSGRQN
jgi:hypothetical protein